MDKIIIKNLQCRCVIGDYEWEREHPQHVTIDLEMECDCRPAAGRDALDETMVDYGRVAKEILLFAEKSSFRLIETLAEKVAQLCLTSFPVQAVTVRLAKPAAIKAAETVSVEIYRQKR